jgi:hypothetical protein
MKHRLHFLSSVSLDLEWHENERVYFSVRKGRGALVLRLHRLFFDAPTPVLEAIICYALKRDQASKAVIRQMAHLYFSTHLAPAKALETKGQVYDLEEILARVSVGFEITGVTIGWARQSRTRFRSILFGSYHPHRQQIQIHPFLDHEAVPLYFLEFIVYHEMLHHICRSKMDMSGRCSIHTKEFREKERQFPHFEQAKRWEKQSLEFFKKEFSDGRA